MKMMENVNDIKMDFPSGYWKRRTNQTDDISNRL